MFYSTALGRLVSIKIQSLIIVGKISDQGNSIVDLTVNIDNRYKLNSRIFELKMEV